MKRKRHGLGLEIRTFHGKDGQNYLVFQTTAGSFHAFTEVEAKEAARQCGAGSEGTPRQMWSAIWKSGA